MTDKQIEKKIDDLRNIVSSWAIKYKLWNNCSFVSYTEYFNDDPLLDNPCIIVLLPDDELRDVMHGPYSKITDELDELMETNLFSYDYDGMAIFFYSLDDKLIKEFISYFEWKWIADLVKPDYTDLYNELFTYFNKNPDKFHLLHPRKFEILINEIFRARGYNTLLGSGTNDQGVDIRIFTKSDIDTSVTLVQVKRYPMKYAIGLEAVAALYGTVIDQKAQKGLFVTSSRYLPGVKRFALRNNHMIELADRNDIAEWSFNAAEKLLDTQSTFFSNAYILGLLNCDNHSGLLGKILASQNTGYFRDTQYTDFFIIIRDTTYVSLIMRIPNQHTSESGNYEGFEMPILNTSIIEYRNKENIFRVKKETNSLGEVSFYGQRRSYHLWDGRPAFFITD